MKNIFEGAKFGDKFLTRDGRICSLVSLNENFAIVSIKDNREIGFSSLDESYDLSGKPLYSLPESLDIVSCYQEPIEYIDFEELSEIGYNSAPSTEEINKLLKQYTPEQYAELIKCLCEGSFVDGFHRAKTKGKL